MRAGIHQHVRERLVPPSEQGELLQERFELAQEQNKKEFENIQKQFGLTQRQNERQFEQIQVQFEDIRWRPRWTVTLIGVVITLLIAVTGWFIIGS